MSIWAKLAVRWVLNRLQEPSTWAAVAAALAAQIGIEGGTASSVTTWLAGGAGLLGIVLKEKKLL